MHCTDNRQLLKHWIRVAGIVPSILLVLVSIAGLPALGLTPENHTRLARVKDVATVEGVRDNQLIGYGIVVGLRGTGDTSQTVFPIQTLISTLGRMGVTLPQSPGETRQFACRTWLRYLSQGPSRHSFVPAAKSTSRFLPRAMPVRWREECC